MACAVQSPKVGGAAVVGGATVGVVGTAGAAFGTPVGAFDGEPESALAPLGSPAGAFVAAHSLALVWLLNASEHV